MQGGRDQIAQDAVWPDLGYRYQHFKKHGAALRIPTEDEYDASARETIRQGDRLSYSDDGDLRVGYFWLDRRRFTALSDDEGMLVSHFRVTVRYVQHLPDLTRSP